MAKSWITKNYPVGKRFNSPNLETGKPEQVEVIAHVVGFWNRVEGVSVQADNGDVFRIDASFLNEDGSGVYLA